MTCTHKTERDFSFVSANGRKAWTCSHCRRAFFWDDGCSYIGNIECGKGGGGYTRGCGFADIDNVACSPACREALGGA